MTEILVAILVTNAIFIWVAYDIRQSLKLLEEIRYLLAYGKEKREE